MVAGVFVDRPRQRRAKARQVAAALVRVDVVGKRENRLLVGGVPLHRDLHRALAALAREVDDLLADRLFVLVQVGDEVLDPALVAELGLVAGAALVDQRYQQPAGQERRLAQTVLERANAEIDSLEDLRVRQEGDRRPSGLPLAQRPALGDRALRFSARVGLGPEVSVAADLDDQTLRQGVDDGHADAVQAAGDLVPVAVPELAAGVQCRQHHLERRAALLLHQGDGNASSVVDDRYGVVGADRHRHLVAEAREGLVHRVVHHLIHKVVQTTLAGRADVHPGAQADCFQAFEDRDVLGVVVGGGALRAFSQTSSNDAAKPRSPSLIRRSGAGEIR